MTYDKHRADMHTMLAEFERVTGTGNMKSANLALIKMMKSLVAMIETQPKGCGGNCQCGPTTPMPEKIVLPIQRRIMPSIIADDLLQGVSPLMPPDRESVVAQLHQANKAGLEQARLDDADKSIVAASDVYQSEHVPEDRKVFEVEVKLGDTMEEALKNAADPQRLNEMVTAAFARAEAEPIVEPVVETPETVVEPVVEVPAAVEPIEAETATDDAPKPKKPSKKV